MPIRITCPGCGKDLNVSDKFAGKSGSCPHCKQRVDVPASVAPQDSDSSGTYIWNHEDVPAGSESLSPTEKQLAYAEKLGLRVPEGIERKALSALIDQAQHDRPATPKQIEFLRRLGLTAPDGIKSGEISLLLDAALDVEAKVAVAVQSRLQKEWEQAGMLTEKASVEQLLDEISNRGRPWCILLLDDDSFRYKKIRPSRPSCGGTGFLKNKI